MILEALRRSWLSCWRIEWQLAGWLTDWLVLTRAGWEAGWPQGLLDLREAGQGKANRLFGGAQGETFIKKASYYSP